MTRNKLFKAFVSTVFSFLIIIICISIFKGPSYIFVQYYSLNGQSKHKSGNFKGAAEDFSKALSHDNQNVNAFISRGSSYLDLEKYDEAISDYSAAINLAPDDPRPVAYRGRAYYQMNDTLKAISDYDQAIKLDSKFAYAYYNRGLVKYTLMADPAGGCADFKTALKLGMTESKESLEMGHCD